MIGSSKAELLKMLESGKAVLFVAVDSDYNMMSGTIGDLAADMKAQNEADGFPADVLGSMLNDAEVEVERLWKVKNMFDEMRAPAQ